MVTGVQTCALPIYYNTEGFAAKDIADADAGTSVYPSKVNVSVQVQVCYALEDKN